MLESFGGCTMTQHCRIVAAAKVTFLLVPPAAVK
jgi:hypothetical protein